MILNAGSRRDSYGDIKIDIERLPGLTVVCDIHYLPFRQKIFSETRLFHVMEHLQNLPLAVKELKRVTDGVIDVKVPVWHLFSFVIHVLSLLASLLVLPIIIVKGHDVSFVKNSIVGIAYWKRDYSGHLWYIRVDRSKVNRKFLLPLEYEFTIVA